MKALSLWQPWATLIAIGAKTIETRHWRAFHRGPLAIHAAKLRNRDSLSLCLEEPFRSALVRAGITKIGDLPFGKMVATCRLVTCMQIFDDGRMSDGIVDEPLPEMPERAFGNYEPGRFALVLKDIVRLPDPIPVIGRQGFFNWDGR